MNTSADFSLTVAGTKVLVSHELVQIGDIRLNPDNPRIRFLIKHRKKGKVMTQAEVLDLIREQAAYPGLQKAIRKAGGLHDPIIIDNAGTVVEGNTRATAIMTLHAGNRSDVRWHKIPVVRLPPDVPERATAMLMAAYHVGGKTVWRPYAQADQLFQLRNVHGWSIEQISDETRLSKGEVQQHLDAYSYLVDEVLPHVTNGDGSEILKSKFSHALEFVKRKNLETLRKDPEVRKNVAKLLVEDKIKGMEMRDLDKVLTNKKASTALKKNGFGAARKVLTESDPVAASKLLKQVKGLAAALSKMGQSDITLLKKSAKARAVLAELNEALRSVASVAGLKFGGRNG